MLAKLVLNKKLKINLAYSLSQPHSSNLGWIQMFLNGHVLGKSVDAVIQEVCEGPQAHFLQI